MLKNSKISYGFFTRSGGVSKTPYKSLNCGFNNEDNKITYLHIINSDKLEFQMISMNEEMIVDNDYIVNRNKYMSGISSNYYEIEYDLNYDIHNE